MLLQPKLQYQHGLTIVECLLVIIIAFLVLTSGFGWIESLRRDIIISNEISQLDYAIVQALEGVNAYYHNCIINGGSARHCLSKATMSTINSLQTGGYITDKTEQILQLHFPDKTQGTTKKPIYHFKTKNIQKAPQELINFYIEVDNLKLININRSVIYLCNTMRDCQLKTAPGRATKYDIDKNKIIYTNQLNAYL
ncbi:hypothetical protein [Cysteiniphilum halobium]|uniref:hypothetical protein n=1 Tax=Cysteiniphilum halobium TaxID=2219059 RepID=UPI000E64ACF9|nr:hypothetical protein [Cysteiniphilum halobium]